MNKKILVKVAPITDIIPDPSTHIRVKQFDVSQGATEYSRTLSTSPCQWSPISRTAEVKFTSGRGDSPSVLPEVKGKGIFMSCIYRQNQITILYSLK
jgi:hypothetical protein